MPRAASISSMGTGHEGAEWLLLVASGRSVGSAVVDWRWGRRPLLVLSGPLLPCSFEEVSELVEALSMALGIGIRRWVELVNRAHTAPCEKGRVVCVRVCAIPLYIHNGNVHAGVCLWVGGFVLAREQNEFLV